jgi:hypothetical protein
MGVIMATKNNTSMASMTDKEKADCLIELHKTQLEHFMQTRDIELKVDIALWTLIAAGGSFLVLHTEIDLKNYLSLILYIITSVVIVSAHIGLWKQPIQKSEDTDDHFINKYRGEVEKLTGVLIEKPPQGLRKSGWPWIAVTSGITLVLLVITGLLLTFPSVHTP